MHKAHVTTALCTIFSVPGKHMHAVADSRPPTQKTQRSGCPGGATNELSGHFAQALWPPREYEPGSQAKQLSALTAPASGEYVSTGQS